jgi:hypothetical protein
VANQLISWEQIKGDLVKETNNLIVVWLSGLFIDNQYNWERAEFDI